MARTEESLTVTLEREEILAAILGLARNEEPRALSYRRHNLQVLVNKNGDIVSAVIVFHNQESSREVSQWTEETLSQRREPPPSPGSFPALELHELEALEETPKLRQRRKA